MAGQPVAMLGKVQMIHDEVDELLEKIEVVMPAKYRVVDDCKVQGAVADKWREVYDLVLSLTSALFELGMLLEKKIEKKKLLSGVGVRGPSDAVEAELDES